MTRWNRRTFLSRVSKFPISLASVGKFLREAANAGPFPRATRADVSSPSPLNRIKRKAEGEAGAKRGKKADKIGKDGKKKRGRGKGKDVKGAGKGKEGDPCKNCGRHGHATKDCKYFDGKCDNCGRHGHRKKDCFAEGGGAHVSGKGKGKGAQADKKGKKVNAVEEHAEDPKNPKVTGHMAAIEEPPPPPPWAFGNDDDSDREVHAAARSSWCFAVTESRAASDDGGSEATVITGKDCRHGQFTRQRSSVRLFHMGGGALTDLRRES